MMGFEELQKVWDEQGETMYVINETALHKIVIRKKNAAARRINCVEVRVSLINGSLTLILLAIAITGHPLIFSSFGVMAASVFYILYSRWKRKKAENTFDRSMLGELDHALSNANYLIRFNYFILIYLISLAIVAISQMLIRNDSLWEWLAMSSAFVLAFFMIRREQRTRNLPGKKQLLALREKLVEE